MRSTVKKQQPDVQAPRAIYDGAGRLGHVVQRGHEVHAYDRRGNPIGVFDDIIDAVNAIGGAARVGREGAP